MNKYNMHICEMENEKLRPIIKGIYTCSWQKSVDVLNLEEYEIGAVICMSLNSKPPQSLQYYTDTKIQHYSIRIDNTNPKADFEKNVDKIVDAISHCTKYNTNLLIHTDSEDRIVTASIIVYMLSKLYQKQTYLEVKYIELLDELTKRGVPVDLERNLMGSVVDYENRLRSKYTTPDNTQDTIPTLPTL